MIDPTLEQIEAAGYAIYVERYGEDSGWNKWKHHYLPQARAALAAAAGAAPQKPTETKTSQDFVSAAVQVDEVKLAEAIGHALDDWQGEELPEVFVARAVAEWLRGGGQ